MKIIGGIVENPAYKLDDLRDFRAEVAMLGTDISPIWNLDNDVQQEEHSLLWGDSQAEADFYGISDFYGTQELAF